MNACQHHIQVLQGGISRIECPILTDAAFNPGEHLDPFNGPVDLFNLFSLPGTLFFGQPPGELRALCMVTDGDILVPERLCSLCHRTDALLPVTPRSMDMEVSAY